MGRCVDDQLGQILKQIIMNTYRLNGISRCVSASSRVSRRSGRLLLLALVAGWAGDDEHSGESEEEECSAHCE